jgi:guanylate kinase
MTQTVKKINTGLVFVVSAPAGTGKTTLVDMLVKEFPSVIRSISSTTRQPRSNEVNGKDYFFITKEDFDKKTKNNEFLESENVFDNYYGTEKKFVQENIDKNKHVVLVIDTQGAIYLKDKIKATFIFLLPPDIETLKSRLEKRSTDSEKIIEERLSWAKKEMPLSKEYDYTIVNDDLQKAYNVLRSILIAEEHKNIKN